MRIINYNPYCLAVAVAGVAEIGELHRSGRLHHIGGHGIVAAQPTDQLRLVSVHGGGQIRILSGLAGLELERLILSGESCNLVLSQEVQDGPAVGVLVVNDVPGGVLDGVLSSCGAGSDIIPHTLDSALGLAAARSKLRSQAVKSLLGVVPKLAHGSINAVEAAGDRVADGGLAVLETVQREALIDVGACGIPLESRAVRPAETAAEAAIAAPSKHAKNQEQDDPGGPVAAPSKAAAVAAIGGHHLHSGICVERHSFYSFFVISNRGHGLITFQTCSAYFQTCRTFHALAFAPGPIAPE